MATTRRPVAHASRPSGASAVAAPRQRRPACTPTPRRAATLLELLIVLSLLVAIAAIALPTTLETMARRQFESDVDALVGQLRLARNHARMTASAVEVTMSAVADDAMRVVASPVDLREIAQDALVAGDDQPPPPADASTPTSAIDASWSIARYALAFAEPEGVAPSRGGPQPSPPTHRRLVVFVADGTAPLAARLVVRDGDGRSATIVVNPGTGMVSMAPAATSSPAIAPDADPDDPAPPDDGAAR